MKRLFIQITIGVLAFFIGIASVKVPGLNYFYRRQAEVVITATDVHRDETLAEGLMASGIRFTQVMGGAGENGYAYHYLASDGVRVFHCNWLARTPQDAQLTHRIWTERAEQVLERSTYRGVGGEECQSLIGVFPADDGGKNFSATKFCEGRYESVMSPSLAHALAYEKSLAEGGIATP